ncbi:MAG: c-type cytochrome [Nitrospirae bacterium]|nr:c-type cytochrome [Nitrospirota bacterium]
MGVIVFTTLLGFLAIGLTAKLPVYADTAEELKLSDEDFTKVGQMYFDKCAGCHGMLRKGATGPALLPEKMMSLRTPSIRKAIRDGLPGGMPDWGAKGLISKGDIDLLARFVQTEPPPPPEMSMDKVRAGWKVHVPVEKRPDKPQHNRNWKDFMGVVLRDVGKVAIVDGTTKELVNVIDTGFAVHILRVSASGRYLYSIGRDGLTTLIDLWMKEPTKVAEVKTCYDARSVEVSKYKDDKVDFRDKYAIVGCYWPPRFVIIDGQTLEPVSETITSGNIVKTDQYLKEARVASIVASHHDPLWVVNVKETGYVFLVDYSDVRKLSITKIGAERFLHDGGWDMSKRYFIVAANTSNKLVVVDTYDKKLEAIVDVDKKPHPGRGATIDNARYGPIWCTGHLGDNKIDCIGTDPLKHKDFAWKVVKRIALPGEGGGNLFIKTHPKSRYMWADRPLNPDETLQRSIHVIDKDSLEVIKNLEMPKDFTGRYVHIEFNEAGNEVWVAIWGTKEQPTALVVYDANDLSLKNVIKGDWVRTPTGHFNVYNSMLDIY